MNMQATLAFDFAPLRDGYAHRAAALRQDPWSDLPAWARDNPENCLQDVPVVVCGSRMAGEVRFLATHCKVLAVVDDFLRRSQGIWMGLPVLSTTEWLDRAQREPQMVSVIGVASVLGDDHFGRAIAQHGMRGLRMLQALRVAAKGNDRVAGHGAGFVYGLPFFRHAAEHAEEQIELADLFADDFSRFTYFSILQYRLTADPRVLQHCGVGHHTDEAGYASYIFNRSFFELGDKEVLVDGGAFDGDSIEQFLRATGGRFDHVYAFEPSPETAASCRARVARLQSEFLPDLSGRIDVIERGLWDKEATLLFNPTQYGPKETALYANAPLAGHVIESGMTQHLYRPEDESDGSFSIHTTSIDAVCEKPPTLIKLEVEGSELKALQGARNTIAQHRPRLAVSMYHKPEDFIELLTFVRDSGQGYRMSLLQHNPHVPDATVCYCY